MRNRAGSTVINIFCVFAIAAVVTILIWPLMTYHPYHSAAVSYCQSNMNQIGKALKMYLSDWDDTFPPNRVHGSSMTSPTVLLSDPDLVGKSGKPVRYHYGVNWVEAIYPYVEKVTEGDPDSAWKCPSSKSIRTATGPYARVSYAFNANLVEMPEGIVRNAGTLMMIRELDRQHDAVLRPTNKTLNSKSIPQDPFLGPEDGARIKYKLHGDGSIILFADGHVKNFPAVYFTNASGEWDSKNKQWFNYANLSPNDAKNGSIAISP